MTDIASLGLYIDSSGVVRATKELRELNGVSAKAETAAGKLKDSFAGLAAGLITTATAMAALNKLVDTGREFGIFNASLKTATGSTEAAAEAFSKLEKFASTTPYSLEQSIDAFIKLKNLGLDPSEEALRSYGNTAAAMGKDLSQMIEAVADASTGEFERLKEFGIKSAKQGDQVTFTFRGVATTIKNTSEDVQAYLLKIGNTEFATAMSERMKTLDGAISNFSDTWNALFRNIINSGVGELIQKGFILATEALQSFMDLVGLTPEAVTKIDATADAAVRLGNAQIQISKAKRELSEINKVEADTTAGLIRQIEAEIAIRSKGIKDENTQALIREGVYKNHSQQLAGISKTFESQRTLITNQLNEEIKKRDEATESIKKYVEANKEKDKPAAAPAPIANLFTHADNGETDSNMSQVFQDRIDFLNDHNAVVEEIVREHNRRVADEEKAAYYARYDIAASVLGSLAQLVEGESKSSFELAKTLASAEVIVSTIAATQKAYESMIRFGPVIAGAAAAAAGLAGLARLKQIQSTTFKSKSAPSTGGSGGPSAPSGVPGSSFYSSDNPPSPKLQTPVIINIGGEKIVSLVVDGVISSIQNDNLILQDSATFNRIAVVRA